MEMVIEKDSKVNWKNTSFKKIIFSSFHPGFNPVQQPIIIHTNSPNSYQPQYHQQQAPTSAPVPVPVSVPTWRLENHPMLPQPSAPPRPNDDSYIDRPPAYEKICAN